MANRDAPNAMTLQPILTLKMKCHGTWGQITTLKMPQHEHQSWCLEYSNTPEGHKSATIHSAWNTGKLSSQSECFKCYNTAANQDARNTTAHRPIRMLGLLQHSSRNKIFFEPILMFPLLFFLSTLIFPFVNIKYIVLHLLLNVCIIYLRKILLSIHNL